MSSNNSVHGRLTHGPVPDSSVDKTLQFVYAELPIWRDKPHRSEETSEEALNAQLCKHLNAAARRNDFSMAHFHHEERQGNRRRVDLSAQPVVTTVIEGRTYHDDEAFLVMEGKRLPADRKSREREYVTGINESGGIQRFKLGLHGAQYAKAAIIAYVQNTNSTDWFKAINGWIEDLANSADATWTMSDQLRSLQPDPKSRTSRSESVHSRVRGASPMIILTHLWIEMNVSAKAD
ncbi:hypothetical protein [Novipirellula rosea]|uniref:Transposase IS66 family protein n=1 Tax=Novipirellula rosea TaxID=1031540 RepID=A0ABP8NF47_9BACT